MNQHISNIKNSVLSLMNPLGIHSSDFPLIYKQIKKPFFISFPNDVYNEHSYQFYSKKHSSSNSKLNRNSITSICGNNKKITEVINYNPKIDLETGLKKTINYYK